MRIMMRKVSGGQVNAGAPWTSFAVAALAICGGALWSTPPRADDVTYGQPEAGTEIAGSDLQDCEQQVRAYAALLACSKLLKVQNLDPTQRTRIFERRGRASLTLFDFGEAVQDFTEVLKAEPENVAVLASRAEALNEHGEHGKAAGDWARMV